MKKKPSMISPKASEIISAYEKWKKSEETALAEELYSLVLNDPLLEKLRVYWKPILSAPKGKELLRETLCFVRYKDKLTSTELDILSAYIVGKYFEIVGPLFF